MEHTHDQHTHTAEHFATETGGLPEVVEPQVIELADGDTVELSIAPVAKQIGDAKVRMLAYNGSVPGPTLRVREGSELVVDVVNQGDLEATVHWHGLRLDNRYDGTHETQEPIPVGGTFSYRIDVPRPGRLLVPPAHPRGLRPGAGSLRQHPRRPRRPGLLAAGTPRAAADARRRPASRTARSRLSAATRRPTRRWAASATSCSSAARPTSPDARSVARSSAST